MPVVKPPGSGAWPRPLAALFLKESVMDMVIFRTIFFELFSFLHVHDPYPPFRLLTNLRKPSKTRQTLIFVRPIVRVHKTNTLGARAPIISGHMLNTLRIQSISDHNVSSGQKSDTFKMYPVM